MPFDKRNENETSKHLCNTLVRVHDRTYLTVSVLTGKSHCEMYACDWLQINSQKLMSFVSVANALKPPKPILPVINSKSPIITTLRSIQKYILDFQYNYTGRIFVPLRKDKGMKHLVFSAKEIMRACLPIQCVESVFVAVYLTNGIDSVSQ
jgi:hypothetical protein